MQDSVSITGARIVAGVDDVDPESQAEMRNDFSICSLLKIDNVFMGRGGRAKGRRRYHRDTLVRDAVD